MRQNRTVVERSEYIPARCSGVELRPWVSLQLMLSVVASFRIRARFPFFADSRRAASPRKRSWISWSAFFTRSRGVLLSRFFTFTSAPNYRMGMLLGGEGGGGGEGGRGGGG